MRWNELKFQLLRIGPNINLKENTLIFSPEYSDIVENKDVIKDLGIMIDEDISYIYQLNKAVNKTRQKSAWVLRTFSTRKIEFIRTMWNSCIQCHLDYRCILWAPYSTKKIFKFNGRSASDLYKER